MEKKDLFERVLDEQNILLSIYSLKSYVYKTNLMSDSDYELFNQLGDIFNKELIKNTIGRVK